MQTSFFIKNLLKLLSCLQINLFYNEVYCSIPEKLILPTIIFLRDNTNCQFKILSTITVIDYPEKLLRFELIYELLSIRFNTRIFLKIFINELSSVNSLFLVYLSAN